MSGSPAGWRTDSWWGSCGAEPIILLFPVLSPLGIPCGQRGGRQGEVLGASWFIEVDETRARVSPADAIRATLYNVCIYYPYVKAFWAGLEESSSLSCC